MVLLNTKYNEIIQAKNINMIDLSIHRRKTSLDVAKDGASSKLTIDTMRKYCNCSYVEV